MTVSRRRIRYHVGIREIGLTPGYRVECVADLDAARVWLCHDIEETAVDAEDAGAFDAFLDRLDTMTGPQLVGEHTIDAYTFTVRAAVDCGCPCDCATAGRVCDGMHNREAATEPQLAEPDEHRRSIFAFDGTPYAVFNTASQSQPLEGFWAVTTIPAEGPLHPSRDYVLAGMKTREDAFARAVEKLRPTRLITFQPKRHASITVPREEREADAYPTVTAEGWIVDWSTDGYAVLFENGTPRAHIYPQRPIEVSIFRAENIGSDTLDGQWRLVETAALAARAHILDSRP